MSHFNVPLIVWAKSQENVHKLPFLKKESRSGSNRDPSAYQPSGKAHKWGLGGWGRLTLRRFLHRSGTDSQTGGLTSRRFSPMWSFYVGQYKGNNSSFTWAAGEISFCGSPLGRRRPAKSNRRLLRHYWDFRTKGPHLSSTTGTLRRKLVSPKKRGWH